MSKVTLVATRVAVRAREERYYRLWRYYSKKGTKLKVGSPEQRKNSERRVWYKGHYLSARSRRRALDKQISRLPITQVDSAGVAFISAEEGLRLKPYNDSAGHATIGVGHLIHRGAVTNADRARYVNFSVHDANLLLARDLDRFEKVVADAFKAKNALAATHNRFNAAVSLAFNIGDAGFKTSTVARKISVGDRTGAADAFLLWKNPPELLPRRQRERRLFLS